MGMFRNFAVLAFAAALLTFSACTSGNTPNDPADAPAIAMGRPVFYFDYRAVTGVLIAKSDPTTGDRWNARIAPSASGVWEVNSSGDAMPLLDRRADGKFILHLMDTMRSLTPVTLAPRGTLESFGLAPPRFAIKWTIGTSSSPSSSNEFELRVGASTPTDSGEPGSWCVFIPPGGSKGMADTPVRVMLARGAALKMLDYIESITSLRHKTLSTITTDDIDEIELLRGRKTVFYAQREGDNWSDRRSRRIKTDVTAQLENITHGRIRDFIDDPADPAHSFANSIAKNPLYEARLIDRHGQATILRVKQDGKRLLGTNTSRSGAVFELYPEMLQFFKPPAK